jgi:hypothetical protein
MKVLKCKECIVQIKRFKESEKDFFTLLHQQFTIVATYIGEKNPAALEKNLIITSNGIDACKINYKYLMDFSAPGDHWKINRMLSDAIDKFIKTPIIIYRAPKFSIWSWPKDGGCAPLGYDFVFIPLEKGQKLYLDKYNTDKFSFESNPDKNYTTLK